MPGTKRNWKSNLKNRKSNLKCTQSRSVRQFPDTVRDSVPLNKALSGICLIGDLLWDQPLAQGARGLGRSGDAGRSRVLVRARRAPGDAAVRGRRRAPGRLALPALAGSCQVPRAVFICQERGGRTPLGPSSSRNFYRNSVRRMGLGRLHREISVGNASLRETQAHRIGSGDESEDTY